MMSSSVSSLVLSLSWAQWIVVVGLIWIAYIYLQSQAPFKKYGNIPQVKPHWFLGNKSFGGESIVLTYQNHYNALKGNRYGIFWDGNEPTFFLLDLDLVKKVQISDFEHFTDFGFEDPEYTDKVGNFFGLASLRGETWRNMKRLVTSPFSIPRLRKITPTINIAVKKVMNYLQTLEKNDDVVDVNLALKKFYMTAIGSVGFGIEIDCFTDEKNEFMKQGDSILEIWRFLLVDLWPSLMIYFKIPIINKKADDFFQGLFKQIIAQRKESGVEGRDIVGNMMQAGQENPDLTEEMMVKTFIQFFTDGYSSAAELFAVMFYQLTINPHIQERAQEQIDEALEGKDDIEIIENEDLEKMPYIDQIIDEGLRMATAPFSVRRCTKQWAIPGENVVIPKGMKVYIPIMGFHYDSDFFEDPFKFDPDRFSPEKKRNIPTGAYQPFGLGPRMCLGYNIMKLETKILLVHLLRKFSLKKQGHMPEKIEWDKNSFLGIVGGVNIKLMKRNF